MKRNQKTRFAVRAIGLALLGVLEPTAWAESAAYGQWALESHVDPMNDQRTIYTYTISKTTGSKWGNPHRLVVRCGSEGELDIYVDWEEFITTNPKGTDMELRFDNSKAKHYLVNPSNDGKAVFINQWFNSFAELIANLKEGEELLARIVPYGESAVLAKFSLDGTTKAIDRVATACGEVPEQKHEYWRNEY